MIEPGASATATLVVGPDDTAEALGSGDLEVLGTPRVVALAEEAAVAACAPLHTGEQTTVGTHVDLRHKAPSPIGAEVSAAATVAEVDGKAIHFDIEVTMAGVIVASGRHTRVIVRRARFGQDNVEM